MGYGEPEALKQAPDITIQDAFCKLSSYEWPTRPPPKSTETLTHPFSDLLTWPQCQRLISCWSPILEIHIYVLTSVC